MVGNCKKHTQEAWIFEPKPTVSDIFPGGETWDRGSGTWAGDWVNGKRSFWLPHSSTGSLLVSLPRRRRFCPCGPPEAPLAFVFGKGVRGRVRSGESFDTDVPHLRWVPGCVSGKGLDRKETTRILKTWVDVGLALRCLLSTPYNTPSPKPPRVGRGYPLSFHIFHATRRRPPPRRSSIHM